MKDHFLYGYIPELCNVSYADFHLLPNGAKRSVLHTQVCVHSPLGMSSMHCLFVGYTVYINIYISLLLLLLLLIWFVIESNTWLAATWMAEITS